MPPATKARAPQLVPGIGGAALMRACLQSALEQVLANVSDIAEGITAAETIHQARVGLRRLRSVLRDLAALSPAIAPDWDSVLAATFAHLGELRDDEVVAQAVRPLLQAAAAPRLSWQPRGRADPVATVRDKIFQRTLLAILALAHADDASFAPLSPPATRAWLTQRLGLLHEQVTRDGRRFQRLPLERQHRVRKRLKRLRYLMELTADLWPQPSVQTYLKRLAAAQDALGHHNDVAVAAAAFRADAAEHPAAWFAAGYLQAHLAVTARAARKQLVKVARAEYATEQELAMDWIENLSQGGAFVKTSAQHPQGTRLAFELALPDGARLEGNAVVAFVNGRGMGLRFELSPEQDAMLDTLQQWVRSYGERDDAWSLRAHRALFDAHPGAKRDLTDRAAPAAYPSA